MTSDRLAPRIMAHPKLPIGVVLQAYVEEFFSHLDVTSSRENDEVPY